MLQITNSSLQDAKLRMSESSDHSEIQMIISSLQQATATLKLCIVNHSTLNSPRVILAHETGRIEPCKQPGATPTRRDPDCASSWAWAPAPHSQQVKIKRDCLKPCIQKVASLASSKLLHINVVREAIRRAMTV